MLATASLEKSFWVEAVNTACYVINRSSSTAVELKTPMEMWTGKPVNYSDLYIFGSHVYVMYNTQETTKLDPKSKKCLFLGYADGVKGYHLWDPTAHKVVVSRDVVFMEDKIQENEEGDNVARETTSIQMEKEFQSNDSFEVAPQHEVNETNESQAPITRTLNRERKRTSWHSDYVMNSNVAYCLLREEGEPSTLQEALNNPNASKPIKNKWVHKIKRNDDDQVEQYRARLVVKGNAQKEGIDFNKKIPLVVRMTTIRVVLPMCATYDLHLEQLDVKTAFLYGNIEEEISMLQLEGSNKDRINKLKAQLARKFEMKDLEPANKILGMQIYEDRVSRKIWLSEKSYVKKILQRFNMQDCKPISTPFPTNVKLSSKMNIAHAVGVVSRYMVEPGREHWEAVKRILRYIKGTSDIALCFGESDLIVKGYVDSDYAGDLDGSKSTTGYVFTLYGRIVSWVLKLQLVVAMLTMEAEYIASAQASKEAVWLQMLLEELGHKQEKITQFCNNQSALYLARNPAFHSKTNHIRVQFTSFV
ncbi:gag-pol polyprotein [Tanacetum coccineum]|uniref:Gag-pol polyprotein n=1 Tax=Tanacetum coccineum TaxID=301880 RepID=A0ABQ5I9E2_9ASTR